MTLLERNALKGVCSARAGSFDEKVVVERA